MTVAEVAALPVGKLARVDAHLWLWVTGKPEVDAGQAGIGGIARASVVVNRGLDGVGDELGHD